MSPDVEGEDGAAKVPAGGDGSTWPARSSGEALLRMGKVFDEYLADCDFDLEGCDGEELREIEKAIEVAKEIRRRIVMHVAGASDARGRAPAVAGAATEERL